MFDFLAHMVYNENTFLFTVRPMVSHASSSTPQGRGQTNKRTSGQLDFFEQLAQAGALVGAVKARVENLVETIGPVRFIVDLPSHLEDHFMEQMGTEGISYVRRGGQRFEITACTP